MTTVQCIQYALDKPGVVTVLGGSGNVGELKEILTYFARTDDELGYSAISTMIPDESIWKCVYCKHCHSCPAGLDIGLINKYYNLVLQGDTMTKGLRQRQIRLLK